MKWNPIPDTALVTKEPDGPMGKPTTVITSNDIRLYT